MPRFAPATLEEETVFGAAAPGVAGMGGGADDPVGDWIAAMCDNDVERACCLLEDPADGLLDRYRSAFGPDGVLHAPVPDGHLVPEATLTGQVLPFLRAADDAGERVVVHCHAGMGRTGQVLAAWLVHARGRSPGEAVSLVENTGRRPREAVHAGNATERELTALLAAAEGEATGDP